MELKVLYLLSLVALCNCIYIDKIVNGIKRCKWNSKTLNLCIKKNIENIQYLFGKGIPALYVPALDEVEYDNLIIDTGPFISTVNNFHIEGLKFFEVISVNMVTDGCSFEIKLNIPVASMRADYSILGELLDIKVNSSGHGFGYRKDVGVTIRLKGHYKVIKGETYLIFNESEFTSEFKGAGYVFMDNIVPGDLEKTYAVNKAFNRDTKRYSDSWDTVLNKYIGTFQFIIRKVFARYPLKDLFVM